MHTLDTLAAITAMEIFKRKNRNIKASSDALANLLEGVTTIRIKGDGVVNGKALSDNVILDISAKPKVAEFKRLFEIVEPKEEFHCMCVGNYAIELLSGVLVKSTIGYHHGYSIRVENWNSDVELRHPHKLVEFFHDLGFKEPLEQKDLDDERARKNANESSNWLENSPRTFSKYFEEMRNMGAIKTDKMRSELNAEFSTNNDLILALLNSYGTTKNLWSAFASYQSVPQELLDNFNISKIIEAYKTSRKSLKHTIGLGRYLFSWSHRSKLKKSKKYLTPELLDLLQQAFEKLQDKKGIESIGKIKNSS